jgi:uncharacterized protein (DUF433 family)
MIHARISIDPAIMMGKPCIKGTRITVELILRKLGAGRSFADLLEAYPKLTEDDVRAALAFANDGLGAVTRRVTSASPLDLCFLHHLTELFSGGREQSIELGWAECINGSKAPA